MNIGIFTDTFKPNINGVVTSILTKKNELEKMGHTVYIIAPYEPGYEETDLNVIRMKSFKLIFQPEYRLAYPPSRKVIKKISRLNLDIIHAETPFSLGLIAKYMAKKLKLPLIHTYHTLFPEYVHYLRLPCKITRKMAEKASAIYCNFCSHVIAPSSEVRNELIRYGVKTKITVIPTGVDTESFLEKFEKNSKKEFRKKYNIKETEKILLYVGRLGKEKNIDFLLEVLHKLKLDGIKNLKFLLVGDGPYKENLNKKICEYKLEDEVVFAGYVDRSKIAEYYINANIFIFASLTETQGLVILEAMAASVPTVAIKASGVEDMIQNEKNGFLCGNSVEEFCTKIKLLLNNEEMYTKLALNAKIRANDFKPKNVIEKMDEIYKEIAAEKIQSRMRKAIRYKKRSDRFLGKIRRRKKNRYSKKNPRLYDDE